MRNLPVHWFEGMFLSPQHFQAADRHWNELQQLSGKFDHGYNYGLSSIKFSTEAIANLTFQVDRCEARTFDGTMISFGEGQDPRRISTREVLGQAAASAAMRADLAKAMESRGAVQIFLAIPKLQLGSVNVATSSDAGLHRFHETAPLPMQDESAGGNDQEIQLKSLSLRLIAKPKDVGAPRQTDANGNLRRDDDDPDFELLTIGQIKRAGESGPELDSSYIPPLLAIDAWPPLQRDIIQKIYDWIGNRIEILSQQVVSRGITLASQEPGDLDRLFMLMRLNEAYASLVILAFSRGIHPHPAYFELVKIVGQLSIFDPSRRPPEIPRYDHDDLGTIFNWVKNQIKTYLDLGRYELQYHLRFFEGRGLGMQVTFDPEWLGHNYKWYVGVCYNSMTSQQCRALLAPNALHWKLASIRQVEGIFQANKPGLVLSPLDQAPRVLPATNWIYFEVSRGGDAWIDVVSTQSLAMRYKDSLVDNRESLEGQKVLIISSQGKKFEMEFALFAVPQRP